MSAKEKLTFIHIPKCAGTYVGKILDSLNILNKLHNLASTNDTNTFTVIRDPIKRFESLLNFRLSENSPRDDWPRHLRYVYKDNSVTLDTIVKKMSDEYTMSFNPYKSLIWWSENIDFFITIEQLPDFLSSFGYTYDINNFALEQVSAKNRGTFSESTKDRLKVIFADDIKFYNKVIDLKKWKNI